MKLKDFFSSCSPSNGKKVKAVKQKYSNLGPKQRPIQISKSQPNLEWKSNSKFQHSNNNNNEHSKKSNSKFYDVCDSSEQITGIKQNQSNTKSGILENIDNYDLSSLSRALDSLTLNVGDRVVWVREFADTTTQEPGTVKWIGRIENEEIAGIEFDRPLGLGSGWYKRKQLFSCAPNHGGLVAVAGLILEEDLVFNPLLNFSNSSTTSSASSSLTSKSKGSDGKRRSYEHVDERVDCLKPSKPYTHRNNYPKSESSSPSWSSGSSGGEPTSTSQRISIPAYSSEYNKEQVQWQGQGEHQISPIPRYENLSSAGYQTQGIETTVYNQFNFDRSSPPGYPQHSRNHQRHYEDSGYSGSGGYGEQRNYKETDLDATPVPSYHSAVTVMPSLPYIHPPLGEESIEKINGQPKGIQGHCNSCYLDATLFAMFSFTSVFDSILLSDTSLRQANSADKRLARETQRILRDEIVNPLRRDYLTPAENVMSLRRTMYHLDDKLTSEEMDPQEFLQILFHNVLNLEEFISLSSGESDFFHQVLCDVNENDREQIPTVQQLFEQSLRQQNLKLKNIPKPALILQMPRSGNRYKTYKGILPNLTIDVTDLIENTPRACAICGELATHECPDCYGKFPSTNVNENHSGADSMSFCDRCVIPIHNKPERSTHKNIQIIKYFFPTDLYFLNLSSPTPNNNNSLNINNNGIPSNFHKNRKVMYGNHHKIPRVTMDLFAVICIETSHFVSFVKCGVDQNAPWVFFDSMADRFENTTGKGHNIPHVKMLPKMGNWLSHLESQTQEQIRETMGNITPELKRLLTDPYICLYYSPQTAMYN